MKRAWTQGKYQLVSTNKKPSESHWHALLDSLEPLDRDLFFLSKAKHFYAVSCELSPTHPPQALKTHQSSLPSSLSVQQWTRKGHLDALSAESLRCGLVTGKRGEHTCLVSFFWKTSHWRGTQATAFILQLLQWTFFCPFSIQLLISTLFLMWTCYLAMGATKLRNNWCTFSWPPASTAACSWRQSALVIAPIASSGKAQAIFQQISCQICSQCSVDESLTCVGRPCCCALRSRHRCLLCQTTLTSLLPNGLLEIPFHNTKLPVLAVWEGVWK